MERPHWQAPAFSSCGWPCSTGTTGKKERGRYTAVCGERCPSPRTAPEQFAAVVLVQDGPRSRSPTPTPLQTNSVERIGGGGVAGVSDTQRRHQQLTECGTKNNRRRVDAASCAPRLAGGGPPLRQDLWGRGLAHTRRPTNPNTPPPARPTVKSRPVNQKHCSAHRAVHHVSRYDVVLWTPLPAAKTDADRTPVRRCSSGHICIW